jgi:hypothetical protein
LKKYLLTILIPLLIISCTPKQDDRSIFYVKNISPEEDGMINYLVENKLHNKIIIRMSSTNDFKHGQKFRFETIKNS